MDQGTLGNEYPDGGVVCRQGEPGNCMYVVQAGELEVISENGGKEVVVGELRPGDIFGEMSIFDRQPRSATVRARGTARVLTLDKRAFLRSVHNDPTVAFRVLERMSMRIRNLNGELVRLRADAKD